MISSSPLIRLGHFAYTATLLLHTQSSVGLTLANSSSLSFSTLSKMNKSQLIATIKRLELEKKSRHLPPPKTLRAKAGRLVKEHGDVMCSVCEHVVRTSRGFIAHTQRKGQTKCRRANAVRKENGTVPTKD
ncbi:hypothetical protein GBAR_LOCUS19773, partial [Geodia barretti]